ncbi:RluA family pseudouridine synthase [Butyrivibrio sp. WCD3002]|uniref:RluA family pseudouridine synthase n=1 Tax=Butyrivibrio sp. WCD3002 TaxID=1280676 RepID=UPI0004138812|nr:RluA family pseudouridine synthase [Butyrivibrio sp. WCD3002]
MSPIEILYEDDDILVCVKPAGVAVQSRNVTIPDMETALRSQIIRSGKFKNKSTTLHVIHRLDQPVEGILVFGRIRKAAASLSSQVQDGGAMDKHYLAVVCGEFPEAAQEGELCDYMYRDPASKSAVIVDSSDVDAGKIPDDAKKSTLTYRVISQKRVEGISLVDIHLHTGRFHQIRAQFSHAGHPLLGDRRYCTAESDELSARLRVKNVALCAYSLSFDHPTTHKRMEFKIEPRGEIFGELKSE